MVSKFPNLDVLYREEGWGRIAEKALGTEPSNIEVAARMVARYMFDMVGDPPKGFTWINKPCEVRGEDFTYQATCLCSFPKSNGKVRYIVEDRGRLFVQRPDQVTIYQAFKSEPDQTIGEALEIAHNRKSECGRCSGKGKFGEVECGSCGGTGKFQGPPHSNPYELLGDY